VGEALHVPKAFTNPPIHKFTNCPRRTFASQSRSRLASLKNLAGQTLWYGLSNVGARLLNVLLTPLQTYFMVSPAGQADFGDFSIIYTAISFANVVYTYGMETAYFRFSSGKEVNKDSLYQTSFGSLIISTLLLSALLYVFADGLSAAAGFEGHPEYVRLAVLIVSFDTLSAIPFARLRQEGRPKKYAFTRLAGILVTVVLTAFFLIWAPGIAKAHPEAWFGRWFLGYTTPARLEVAGLAGSATTFLLLFSEWRIFRFRIDVALLRTILTYSAPFIIIGLGGMVNETFDRYMLGHLSHGTPRQLKIDVAIYSANYKISIFIQLFIQAFRMAAEPFFFAQSADKNAPKTYAKVMKWFVLTLCFAFLFTTMFLDIWKHIISKPYRSGLGVVPILLYANMALGIYYNLAVWYKISGRLGWGMAITIFGAILTLTLNYAFIPTYGMWACAWTTLLCYVSMMIICYAVGQKHFPVPYPVRKLLSYLAVMTTLFFVQYGIGLLSSGAGASGVAIRLTTGILFMGMFAGLVFRAERQELGAFPVIGKYLR
jgi:O-antigen/teichoic acid export membrane protein